MAKLFAKRFYNSKAWLQCRKSYIAKVFGLCEHCEAPGYILDHIVELTPENINDPSVSLNHSNLQYLCTACHNRKTFGNRESATRDDVMFNEYGELVRTTND